MELENLRTNSVLENNGVWKSIGNAKVLVASLDNPEYTAMLAIETKPYQMLNRAGGEIPTADIELITIKVIANTILKGWENITIKGEVIPYTIKNAVMVLTDYPRFRDAIAIIASDISNYRDSEEVVGK